MAGHKIIEGLKDAVAGNFSSVTIEGQRWIRVISPSPAVAAAPIVAEFCERCNEQLVNGQNIFTTKTGLVHFPKCPTLAQPSIDKTKFYAALSSHLANDMIDIVWQAVQESER